MATTPPPAKAAAPTPINVHGSALLGEGGMGVAVASARAQGNTSASCFTLLASRTLRATVCALFESSICNESCNESPSRVSVLCKMKRAPRAPESSAVQLVSPQPSSCRWRSAPSSVRMSLELITSKKPRRLSCWVMASPRATA